MINQNINDKYKGEGALAILYSEGSGYFLLKNKIGCGSMLISLHKDEYSDCDVLQIFGGVNLELVNRIINEKLLEDLKEKRITESDLEIILQA